MKEEFSRKVRNISGLSAERKEKNKPVKKQ
jgi:hypothetical protein